jgi:hypothetical protein
MLVCGRWLGLWLPYLLSPEVFVVLGGFAGKIIISMVGLSSGF